VYQLGDALLHGWCHTLNVHVSCAMYSTVGEISLRCIVQALYLETQWWRKGTNLHGVQEAGIVNLVLENNEID